MGVRKLLFVAVLLSSVAVLVVGCGRTAPPEEAGPAPEPAASTEAEAPAAGTESAPSEAAPAAKPTDMMCIKGKCAALGEAAEAKDLDKIKAAAKDLCGAICAYKPMKAELCKDEEFMKMCTMCTEAYKKIQAATTAEEAAKLVTDAKATCKCCHDKYKPMPAKTGG